MLYICEWSTDLDKKKMNVNTYGIKFILSYLVLADAKECLIPSLIIVPMTLCLSY